jgi:hypothetical protein
MSILQQFNSDGGFVTTGNVNAANVVATHLFGDGANITGITATANTGNVTFSDQTVIGTGDGYGGSGLYLAPGPDSVTGNTQYFRVRGGDYPTHIHLDTGNNAYYDQYFGDDYQYIVLASEGNILINSNDLVGNTAQWAFDTTGNLTLPGNTFAVNYANGNPVSISGGGGQANAIYNGTSNVTIPNSNGNVYINTNDGSGYQWIFDTVGNITLPGGTSNGVIMSQLGSNGNITMHPDGTGTFVIKGDNPQLITAYSDTANSQLKMVIETFGNSLANIGGGGYVGSYRRTPGVSVRAGDRLVTLQGRGSFDGSNYSFNPAGSVSIFCYGGWTANSQPTYTSFLNTPTGTTSQVENMRIEPNGNVTVYNGNIISRGAYVTGLDGTGNNAAYLGVSGYTELGSNVIVQSAGNVNSYAQINFQNINTGTQSSTDFILTADNGTDTTHYFDMGIAGGNWDGTQPNSLGTAVSAGDGYLWVQDGNVRIATTVGNAAPYVLSLTTDGNVVVPAQNVSGSQGESAVFRGTRRIVNGQYSGAAYGYSAELAAGGTPSIAYTATNEYVQSVRLTFAVESVGSNPQWEQFDVVATKSLDTAGTVNFVVSNRIKARASIADTTVTATINLANEIEISLNLDAAQTSGWSSFDAVEFGVMFN